MPTERSLADRTLGRLVAPDATRAEWVLTLTVALGGAVLATLHAARTGHASGWRLAVVAFLAFDVLGGVVGNCADSAKRHWHAPGRPTAAAGGFVAGHLLHLALVGFLLRRGGLPWLGATGALLLVGGGLVLAAPRSIVRAAAAAVFAAAVLTDAALGPTPGLEWFAPLFFFKIVVAHLVPEEARPAR